MRTLEQHESECQVYQSLFSEILLELTERKLPLRAKFGTFAPHLQYITLDALNPNDWPCNISHNSIFVSFKVDLFDRTIECNSCGHIYLTKADQQASYLCCCSMKNAAKAVGCKWFRKAKYKSAEDLADKVQKFWGNVVDALGKATNGYPYKQMKINIYC